MILSGPMFQPAEDSVYRSAFGKSGAHYNIYAVHEDNGMRALREFLPNAKADEMNFVLFSTSGVHGTYSTIEDAAKGLKDPDNDELGHMVTFLIVQPRICCLRYGNCIPQNDDDIRFLKELRASSWKAVQAIGKP